MAGVDDGESWASEVTCRHDYDDTGGASPNKTREQETRGAGAVDDHMTRTWLWSSPKECGVVVRATPQNIQ